jgi:opacity protein-like surface antigen
MKRILAIAALSIVAFSAQAQLYVGAGASSIRAEAEVGSDSGAAPSLIVGYQVAKYFSVEASTFRPDSLLERSFSVQVAPDTATFSKRVWDDASGYSLSVLGTMPITSNLSAIGRVSAYRMKARYSETNITTQCPTPTTCAVLAQSSESANASETLLGLGIGAEYEMIPQLRMRLMYERIKPKSEMFGSGNDLDRISTTSVEILYQF